MISPESKKLIRDTFKMIGENLNNDVIKIQSKIDDMHFKLSDFEVEDIMNCKNNNTTRDILIILEQADNLLDKLVAGINKEKEKIENENDF